MDNFLGKKFFCFSLSLTPLQYLEIKEDIINEYRTKGTVSSQIFKNMVNIDEECICRVIEFLSKYCWINQNKDHENNEK